MVALRIYSRSRAGKHIHADNEVAHLLEAFDGLRAFVTETVRTGDAAIVYLA